MLRNRIISPALGNSAKYIAAAWLIASAAQAEAGVVVLQNRTVVKIEYIVNSGDGSPSKHALASTDIDSIRAAGPVAITYNNGEEPKQFNVVPNAIYYFTIVDNRLQLVHMGLAGIDVPDIRTGQMGDPLAATPKLIAAGPQPPGVPPAAPGNKVFKVPVVILADGAEPRVQSVWEKRIRARFNEASDVFEHHCGVRFEIVDVRTWDSDPKITSFNKSLEDFERKVVPAPARLAVGFTGRFKWEPGEVHLGGTHGALRSHILIRESVANVAESEHLEVLVHELGHFLGAVHSVDPLSVMRPKLGDRRSRAKSFRIGFDVFNTLAMSLLAEDMQRRPVWGMWMLPPTSKAAMRSVYSMLGETLPNDPAAQEALMMLGPAPMPVVPASTFPPPLVSAVKDVVAEIAKAAAANHKLPGFVTGIGDEVQREGDQLTNYYVRRAAAAAQKLPPEIGPTGFIVGLGIGLDDMTLGRDKPLLFAMARQVETGPQRQARLSTLGKPGIAGRDDLARHFFVAAAMAVLATPREAESAMVWKELSLAHNGGAFSFAEYDADLSGCVFGAMVHDRKLPLDALAAKFAMADYVRHPQDMREDIRFQSFQSEYGGPGDERFQRQRAEFVKQILDLPVYQGKWTQ